ncbi:uncharacterized protein [Argopecten irradians]|uniref:uncharacterized protein isoform X2 n=1 Tax=Argopecten irradians TaxID=31199 RepID=UPI00371C508E
MGFIRKLVFVAVVILVAFPEDIFGVSSMYDGVASTPKGRTRNGSTNASTVTEEHCQTIQLTRGLHVKYSRRSVRFYCYPPFLLYGAKRAICVGGSWTGNPPLCIANRCPDIPISDEYLYVTRRYQGALMVFSCPSGMNLRGDNLLTCDGEKWSGTVPVCTRNYLYMESSGYSGRDEVARLISPWFRNVPIGTCFQFFYHMLGNAKHEEFSSLSVYIRDHQMVEDLLFTTTGSHGNRWIRGLNRLREYYQLMQIVIQATRTTNWAHDVAIDDVMLYNCSDKDFEDFSMKVTTEVTSVTNHVVESSPAEIKPTTSDHVTSPITDSSTSTNIFREDTITEAITNKTFDRKVVTNTSRKQNNMQNNFHPNNFTNFTFENVSTMVGMAKIGTNQVDKTSQVSGSSPMSKNELYTLYTGIVVTVIIILLLLLTILVGVQVQWRKRKEPRDQTRTEVIEMQMMAACDEDLGSTDATSNTNSSVNLFGDEPCPNENGIFCTHL